ncbi:MAG: molecular chaperone [Acidiferrobacterales bacterium]
MNKASDIAPSARSNVYQFLTLGFGYPDAALLAQLNEQAHPLEASLIVLQSRKSLDAARVIRSVLRTITIGDLEASYVQCFGHTISKECPPYEAEYGQAHIFQKSQCLADIAGFYKAFGLELAPDLNDRLDHIGVELEFMHFLCLKAAYALDKGHPQEQLALCRDAQAKFLREHLGRWAPGFARKLANKAGSTLYGRMGRLLTAFLTWELRGLGLKPAKVAGPDLVAQQPEEGPAGCEACLAPIPAFPLNKV